MADINKDSGIQITTGNWTRVDYSGTNPPVHTSGPAVVAANRSTKTGVTIDNYHKRKKRGELLPHTAFNQVEWSAMMGTSSVNVSKKTGNVGFRISGYEGTGSFPNIPWRIVDFPGNNASLIGSPPVIPDYFLQQAAAAIQGSGYDALTASAEGRKTISGFKGVARRMVDLARRYSNRRMLKLWLEGRYQWRILAYDVRDLHYALTEFDRKRTLWTERSGTTYYDESSAVVGVNNALTGTHTLTRTESTQYSIRGAISALITPAQFQTNLVKTGWELVPYSFVIDWVYGVGVALDALAFRLAAKQYTASKGFQIKSSVTFQNVITSNAAYNASGGTTYTYVGTRQNRVPSSIPTLPQLTGRALTSDLVLDLRALSEVRNRFR